MIGDSMLILLLYVWAAVTISFISWALDNQVRPYVHIVSGIFWPFLLLIFIVVFVYEWLKQKS